MSESTNEGYIKKEVLRCAEAWEAYAKTRKHNQSAIYAYLHCVRVLREIVGAEPMLCCPHASPHAWCSKCIATPCPVGFGDLS
jgi:hypothetical protein